LLLCFLGPPDGPSRDPLATSTLLTRGL
jgi:hypothetical protein